MEINNVIVKNLASKLNITEEEAEQKLSETLNDPESIDRIQKEIQEDITRRQAAMKPMSREQRRRLMKKAGKAGRVQMSSVNDTAKKLDYINLIQQLRELNKKKENENYEGSNEDD